MFAESPVSLRIETIHRPVVIKWVGDVVTLPDNVIAEVCKHGADHNRPIYQLGVGLRIRGGVQNLAKEQVINCLVKLGLERITAVKMSDSMGGETFTFFGFRAEEKLLVAVFDRPMNPQPQEIPYSLTLAKSAGNFETK